MRKDRPRSFKKTAFTIVGIFSALFAAILAGVFYFDTFGLFAKMETKYAHTMEAGFRGALGASLGSLRGHAETWSARDGMYRYARGEERYFVLENFSDGKLLELYGLAYILIEDTAGQELYLADSGNGELPPSLRQSLSELSARIRERHSDASADTSFGETGFIRTEYGIFAVAANPILPSNGRGSSAGLLFFVAPFERDAFARLTNLEASDVALYYNNTATGSGGNGSVVLRAPVRDIGNDREAFLTVELPENPFGTQESLVGNIPLLLAGAFLASMFAFFFAVDRKLLRPLGMLDAFMRDRGADGTAAVAATSAELASFAATAENLASALTTSEKQGAVWQEMLGALDCNIHVSDAESGEVLFVNRTMRETFGIGDEALSKKCWQVFQTGFEERCDFCPCAYMDEEGQTPMVWEEQNTVNKRFYRNADRLIDWADGRKAYFQQSLDISGSKDAEKHLQKTGEQRALVVEIVREIVAGGGRDSLIYAMLQQVGSYLNLSRAVAIRCDMDLQTLTFPHEWQNPNYWSMPRQGTEIRMQEPHAEALREFLDRPGGTATAEEFAEFGGGERWFMGSEHFLMTPLVIDGQGWGVLEFGKSSSDEGPWAQSDRDLLATTAALLGTLLAGSDESAGDARAASAEDIAESTPLHIFDTRADRALLYLSPATEAISGHSWDELHEKGLQLLYPELELDQFYENTLPQVMAAGCAEFEMPMRHKDGTMRTMRFSCFVSDPEESVVRAIAFDVTTLRKEARELRTARAAKERAEEGLAAKNEFLVRMSHEIRTPMNAVMGMTNIARNTDDILKKDVCLDKVAGASKQLLGVINDILDLSKIEANKLELRYREFMFDKMLMGVLNAVNFRVEEKKQKLTLDVDPALPSVLIGDEERLAQVISNLLVNAVKFTPEKGIIGLGVQVLGENEEEVSLRVEVTDNGVGISEEQQKILRHSFEPGAESIVRKFGGSELGLVISKRIVELMEGEIRIESTDEGGSRFGFTVTLEKGAGYVLESIKKEVILKDVNVLVVDDSLETRDYFAHIMAGLNVSCAVAPGAREALTLMERLEKPFDIIFIDWQMPGMDGIELTKEIRRREGTRPKIVMISAAERKMFEGEALEAGADGFVSKPLYPSLIVDCINRYVEAPSAQGSAFTEDERARAPEFAGKKLLLAEDVDVNREIVLALLEGSGVEIDCIRNGAEALRAFEENPGAYDIIFMDSHMPEMDGLEATRRIRALEDIEAKTVPIVAMTANAFPEDVERCIAAGMNDHIAKPIDFEVLLAKLRKYLG